MNKNTFLNAVLVIGFTLASNAVLASGLYSASLSNGSASFVGLVSSNFTAKKSQLVISKDGNEILRIPVVMHGEGYGFSMGIAKGNSPDLRIDGLTDSTKVGDIFGEFVSTISGYAWVIPGPCCVGNGKIKIEATHKKSKLKMYSSFSGGGGIGGFRAGNIPFKLELDKESNLESLNENITLKELSNRRAGFELPRDSFSRIACDTKLGHMTIDINQPDKLTSQIDIYDHNGGLAGVYWGGANVLASLNESKLVLVSKQGEITGKVSVDLNLGPWQNGMWTRDVNYVYSATGAKSLDFKTALVEYDLLAKGQHISGYTTCYVASQRTFNDSVQASLILREYFEAPTVAK